MQLNQLGDLIGGREVVGVAAIADTNLASIAINCDQIWQDASKTIKRKEVPTLWFKKGQKTFLFFGACSSFIILVHSPPKCILHMVDAKDANLKQGKD